MQLDLDVTPVSKVLKALADDTRLRIVALLAHGELCVCHVESALDLQQPTVSRNLAILRHAGVVHARRDGNWMYYRLAEQADPTAAATVSALVNSFAASIASQDVERLRKTKGPTSCR